MLAGYSLHALAFEILADPATHEDPFVRSELVLELARASGTNGMAGGQMMDLAAERQLLDLPAITRLQQLKTGALIEYAVEAGTIMALLPHSNTPHYDSEAARRPLYQRLVGAGTLPAGWATDDGVGLHFRGTELVGVVSGLVQVIVGSGRPVLRRGETLLATRRGIDGWRNVGDSDARCLWILRD